MTIIADGVLIFACLTTAFYCYVLSNRLRKLTNTDEGVGQQIVQLSQRLEETRSTVEEIKSATQSETDRLSKEITSARKASRDLTRVVSNAEETIVKVRDFEKRAEKKLSRPMESRSEPRRPVAAAAAENKSEKIDLPDSPQDDDVFDDDGEWMEVDEIDAATVVEELISAPLGSQQIGFGPSNIAETDLEEPEVDEAGEEYDQRGSLSPDFEPDDTGNEEDLAEEKVLKVERMGL